MGSTTSGAETAQQLLQQPFTANQRLVLLACFKTTLTLEEAAAYAGLSTSHFYKLTSAGKVPHYKPAGKVIYFDRAELDSWLKSGRVKTTDEIEKEATSYVSTGPSKQSSSKK